MSNEQEDLYYEVRAALKNIFGVEPETDKMNYFFFTYIWPEHSKTKALEHKLQRIQGALQILKEEINE